jgi:hypothetical protein
MVLCSNGIAVAQGPAPLRRVDLRISQSSSSQGSARFRGDALVRVPARWSIHRSASDEVKLSPPRSPQCSAHATVSSLSTISGTSPSAQLRVELPRASEPAQPVPLPVAVIATGRPVAAAGSWELVQPPPKAQSFTLYGATLIMVSDRHWSGITLGFVASSGCSAAQSHGSRIRAALVSMLRTAALHGAGFG